MSTDPLRDLWDNPYDECWDRDYDPWITVHGETWYPLAAEIVNGYIFSMKRFKNVQSCKFSVLYWQGPEPYTFDWWVYFFHQIFQKDNKDGVKECEKA
jgi:hypothetical protein